MSRPRSDTATRHRTLRNRSLIASVGLTLVLIAAKLLAWLLGGSVAMLSSLLDSTLDGLSSLITVLSVYHAARPADFNHRFGHAKAEPMAAFAQCIFISASAFFVAYESLHRLIKPEPVDYTLFGIGVMLASTVGLLLVIALQRRVVQVTGSMAIEAESLNYRGDLLLNLGVIGSLGITHMTGLSWVDPLFGIAIVGLLVRNSLVIGRRALAVLMDEELDPAERERIRNTILKHPKALGVHDLRTRHSGQCVFIEMHLEVDGSLSLHDAHDIATEVEDDLRRGWPGAEILIHQEPHGLEDEKLDIRIGTP